jgi:hypothetical protein
MNILLPLLGYWDRNDTGMNRMDDKGIWERGGMVKVQK